MKFTHRFTEGLAKYGDIEFTIDKVEAWGPHDGNDGGLRVQWSASVGWGEVDFFIGKNGMPVVATETYGKEFVAKVLLCLLENAELKD